MFTNLFQIISVNGCTKSCDSSLPTSSDEHARCSTTNKQLNNERTHKTNTTYRFQYKRGCGVLRIGDIRTPYIERETIATKLFRKSNCCANHGIERGIYEHCIKRVSDDNRIHVNDVTVQEAVDFLMAMHAVLFLVATCIKGSIAHVENLHRAHRIFCSCGEVGLQLLQALSVCSQSVARKMRSYRGDATVQASPRSHRPQCNVQAAINASRRAFSPSEVFKLRHCSPTLSRTRVFGSYVWIAY